MLTTRKRPTSARTLRSSSRKERPIIWCGRSFRRGRRSTGAIGTGVAPGSRGQAAGNRLLLRGVWHSARAFFSTCGKGLTSPFNGRRFKWWRGARGFRRPPAGKFLGKVEPHQSASRCSVGASLRKSSKAWEASGLFFQLPLDDGDVILGDIAEGFHLTLRGFFGGTDARDVIDGAVHIFFIVGSSTGLLVAACPGSSGMVSCLLFAELRGDFF